MVEGSKRNNNERALSNINIAKKLGNLYKRGFIRALRGGDTGIGYTLEELLNIKENNDGQPDFKYNGLPVELKAQRASASSRITLITKTPNWEPLKPGKIIEKFGYENGKGRTALKITMDTNGFNNQGFALLVGKRENKLYIVHKDYGVTCYFNITDLMEKIKDKLYENLLLVLAETKKEEGKQYFKYTKGILLQNLSEEAFEHLIDEGEIVFEFRMHIKEDGGVRDHGPGFRIKRDSISELYSNRDIIFDSSNFSQGQK